MELEYAKNPVWANAEHTMIDLQIKWSTINDEYPFTARPDDCEAYGRVIYEQAVAGNYGVIAEYIPPVVTLPEFTPPSGVIPIGEV